MGIPGRRLRQPAANPLRDVGGLLRRLAQKLVSMPSTLLRTGADLFSRNDLRPYLKMQTLPTAIDNMAPGHPFIRTIAEIPVAPGVHAHSIIAVDGDVPKETGGDGVVKYVSAHIDGVESERIINSPHSCQSNPDTIDEVLRILRVHAAGVVCGRSDDAAVEAAHPGRRLLAADSRRAAEARSGRLP